MSPDRSRATHAWSPEEQLILLAARTQADDSTTAALVEQSTAVTDWDRVLHHGYMHGLLPILYTRLREAGVSESVPGQVLQALSDTYTFSAARTLQLSTELGRILDALEQDSIAALPIKGPVLGALVYTDPSLRPFVDLDIIVPRNRVDEAVATLARLGFEAPNGPTRTRRKSTRLTEYATHLAHRSRRTPLDLHWSLARKYFSARVPEELLWESTRRLDLAGRSTVVPNPAMLLLLLSVHGSKHGPFPWPKLKWVVDLDGFARARDLLDWEKILRRSVELGGRRMLLLGFALAEELLRSPLPEVLRRAIERDRPIRALTSPIVSRLFADQGRVMSFTERTAFDLRLRDRGPDRLRYLIRRLTLPGQRDVELVDLPARLSFLYTPLRLARLTAVYLAQPWNAGRRLSPTPEPSPSPQKAEPPTGP